MIQDAKDLDDLAKLNLTQEEVEGYLVFFANNFITPLSTIFEEALYEK